MIRWVLLMFSLTLIQKGYAQQLDTFITVDTRAGYSTNTLLNPFFGEWDRRTPSGYGLLSPAVTANYYHNKVSVDMSAGGMFEVFTSEQESLYGGYLSTNTRYRISHRFSAGLETGGNRVSTGFDRRMFWIQPVVSWSPSLFTRINARLGSSFRSYDLSDTEEENGSDEYSRFDLYGLELESWQGFRWLLRAGVYGDLSSPTNNISFMGSAEYHVNNTLSLTAKAGIDQYKFRFEAQSGTGNTFPPIGGPSTGEDTILFEDRDRIYRAGVRANYSVNRNISLHVNADQLYLNSSLSDESILDYQVSAGLRVAFSPSFTNRGKASAGWQLNGEQVITLRINYSGDGEVYLVGDFNDWHQPGIPLHKQGNRRYVARLSLDPGAYEYKILLLEGEDESWIEFTDETLTISDGFGGENGLIIIE
jgi:hypothetical protein